ncbi:membrane-bound lytic murein transglycosylase B [Streptomyces sp. B3I7]|uniref:lytic transglycosylase domain-containing protein n=1 Tax=Streptomyces sp. B3I7 TaxID=3042269 RepID=UPI00278586C9|nr:lytic transglycosylase domain-containing protein [Streptomyces sp. B3I7]MDQ0814035.1 membrane-bound lytic murein transglycosylase B [Streptomyces sp. B3I7]
MAAHFGRRLRKGAATTALAAAAVAALSASQAPGVTADDHGRRTTGAAQDAPDVNGDGTATGDGHYYTDLPPLDSPTPSPGDDKASGSSGAGDDSGIPATVLDAYKKAEAELRESKPGCNLPWQLLAAIGHVESGQARGGRVDAQGTTYSKILGPVLNGSGFAHISDTDHGAYDGDSTYDRAVGPMQFIPSTWAWAGRDGNDDGVKDPNNVYDAALAAGHYLCRADRDLSVQANLDAAILSYNHSQDYLNTVLSWLEFYRKGTHSVPDGTGTLPRHRSDGSGGPGSGTGSTPLPPVTPTKPSAHHTTKPGHSGSGSGSHSGSDSGGKPSTEPSKPSTPPAGPPPTPTDTVDHLDDAGTGTLTARAGGTFDKKIAVRPETKAGTAVAKVRVRFVVVGDTDATFTGGEKTATVVTGGTGTATAPALVAGEKTGDFTVRALVVGRTVAALDHTATVTERTADALARVGDTPLTCTPGGEFAEQIQLAATYKGAAPGKVAATATLIRSADDATENDKGPYFKDPDSTADDADKKPVRTLAGLTTDADGVLKLPKLYADDTTGTFLLRVTTAGGATVTLELKVAAAAS